MVISLTNNMSILDTQLQQVFTVKVKKFNQLLQNKEGIITIFDPKNNLKKNQTIHLKEEGTDCILLFSVKYKERFQSFISRSYLTTIVFIEQLNNA